MTPNNSLDDASWSLSKLSLRWDVGSCSASSSVFSTLSLPLVSIDDQIRSQNLYTPSDLLPFIVQSSNSNVSELDCQMTEDCRKGGQWITSDSNCIDIFRFILKFSSLFIS